MILVDNHNTGPEVDAVADLGEQLAAVVRLSDVRLHDLHGIGTNFNAFVQHDEMRSSTDFVVGINRSGDNGARRNVSDEYRALAVWLLTAANQMDADAEQIDKRVREARE